MFLSRLPVLTSKRIVQVRMSATSVATHRREIQNRNAQWGSFQYMEVESGGGQSGGKSLVMLSDVFGMATEFTLKQPVRFIESGVADRVLIPDLYQNNPFPAGQPSTDLQELEAWRKEFTFPYERVVDIALTLVEELIQAKQVLSVGIVGYCYGGGRMVDLLTKENLPLEVKAGVGFYATRLEAEIVKKLKKPVLLVFAEHDKFAPVDLAQSIKLEIEGLPADRRGHVEIFPNRDHGFVHYGNADDQEDSNKAMEMATNWLKTYL